MRKAMFGVDDRQSIIGMLHLLPLPGAPGYAGDARRVVDRALADAAALQDGGVDAILIENFGDTPYWPHRVPVETIAWMSRIGSLVRRASDVPLGVCVLRNDGRAALAIAHSIEAQFIRICVFGFPRVTDQGVIQGCAFEIVRDRARLGADVKIFADVDIKHSYPLGAGYSRRAEAADIVARSHADALIVTGAATGESIAESDLSDVLAGADVPVFIGSGVTDANVARLSTEASGFIVGTALKASRRGDAPVSVDKVRALVRRHHGDAAATVAVPAEASTR